MEPDELITTAQAAVILRRSVAWVNKLAGRGDLPVAKKLPGATGSYLFCHGDVVARAEADAERVKRERQPAA